MFTLKKSDTGAAQPWEYYPAKAGTYKAGQLLAILTGTLVAISAASTTTPAYLCEADITVEDGQNVPVTRVTDDAIYETQLSAAAAAAAVGSMLQVSAGGLQVDAGAEGSFEVVYIEDTSAGAVVHGRFH